MNTIALIATATLTLFFTPDAFAASAPNPNYYSPGAVRQYRSYRPTTRSINASARSHRKWMGNNWRNFTNNLERKALIRRGYIEDTEPESVFELTKKRPRVGSRIKRKTYFRSRSWLRY